MSSDLSDTGRSTQTMGRLAWFVTVLTATTALIVLTPSPVGAITVPVPLGSAADFAVLAGTTVTNSGLTEVTGDIGVSPGTTVTGFPPGVVNGTIHTNDASAMQGQADLAVAYNDAVARTTTDTIADGLGGQTLSTGVYDSESGTFEIAGTLTLDAEGDPNAVFIFKTATTLITADGSDVVLANGAQACNVFYQVGSSATLGANSLLRGNVLATASITSNGGGEVDGRTLAMDGTVSLDTDVITTADCLEPGALSITAPPTAVLSNASPGDVASGALGPVTVTDERLLSEPTWIATVVSTDFVNDAAPIHVIAAGNVFYWSGVATTTTGIGTFTPGQPTTGDAESLDVERTAYTLTDGTGNNSATWSPTVSVQVPAAAVAGGYTATVTHSVA